MKIDLSNPATRFLALSAIALTLSSAPSRADWTTVRADGSIVTVPSTPRHAQNQEPTEVPSDYASDTYDGPSSAPASIDPNNPVEQPQAGRRPSRAGNRDGKGRLRPTRRGNGRTIVSGGVYSNFNNGYPIVGLPILPGTAVVNPYTSIGGLNGRNRIDTSVSIYPGSTTYYGAPGYGYGVPSYGVPYGYYPPATTAPGGVTVITTPSYTAPGVQTPGFPPFPRYSLPGTSVETQSQTTVTYPGVIVQQYPGYPQYGYPQYGYPQYGGNTTYGGLSVSRSGVNVTIGGSRTKTQTYGGYGTYGSYGTGVYR